MIRRILVAVDDSAPAARALEVAAYLALALGARLALLHVVDPSLVVGVESGIAPEELLQQLYREGHELLCRLAVPYAGVVRMEQFLREGEPARLISGMAREWAAQLPRFSRKWGAARAGQEAGWSVTW